jgi:hypothetical protein
MEIHMEYGYLRALFVAPLVVVLRWWQATAAA